MRVTGREMGKGGSSLTCSLSCTYQLTGLNMFFSPLASCSFSSIYTLRGYFFKDFSNYIFMVPWHPLYFSTAYIICIDRCSGKRRCMRVDRQRDGKRVTAVLNC